MSVSPASICANLEGFGLRSGLPAYVRLHARPGPFAFLLDGAETLRSAIRALEVDRATVVQVGAATLATVEHLLAACAGLGLHDGVLAEVVGGEVPLLDGGSREFVTALESLGLPPFPASLRVVRAATLSYQESRYTFEPGPETRVSVTLSYDDPRIAADASWNGTAGDFVSRIASARTFAFAHEVAGLASAGHASHVDATSVIVLAPDAILTSGAPFAADEPARHKLLDLMGDLFLYGGPPRGRLHAFRPGHRATHAILREALEQGIVVT